MGQRLVITIKDNGKNLANAYYHWSGYTESAMSITSAVLDEYFSVQEKYEKLTDLNEKRLIAVKLLYSTGARLSDSAEKELGELFPGWELNLDGEPNRNEGIIEVTESGMQTSLEWSEGDVYVDLAKEEIWFGVYTIWSSEDMVWDSGDDGPVAVKKTGAPKIVDSSYMSFGFDEWFSRSAEVYEEIDNGNIYSAEDLGFIAPIA